MIRIGIVGMGVIGTHIAKAIDNGIPGVALAGVSVRTATKAGGYPAFPLDELIQQRIAVLHRHERSIASGRQKRTCGRRSKIWRRRGRRL